MPAHKDTTLQICIICFLVFMLGARVVVQYPNWFNGEQRSAERFITVSSATSTEDSGFFRHVLPQLPMPSVHVLSPSRELL